MISLGSQIRGNCVSSVCDVQVEIYCERVRDLMQPESTDLNIQRDDQHGYHVAGAKCQAVSSSQMMMDILAVGMSNRVLLCKATRLENALESLIKEM